MQGKSCPSRPACPVHPIGPTNTTVLTMTPVKPFCPLRMTCGVPGLPAFCRTLKQSLLLQFLGCWIIFCAANVVKALLAKKMASHFHKQTHFQKMRDAIKKVCLDMYMRFFSLEVDMHALYMWLWILPSNATAARPNISHGCPAITSTG
jgi:hypothetical protein